MKGTWPEPALVLNDDPLYTVAFWHEVASNGYRRVHRASWATDVQNLDQVQTALLFTEPTRTAALCAGADAAYYLDLRDGSIHVGIGANEQEVITSLLAVLHQLFPPSESSDELVPVTFWSYSQQGPRSITRKIAVQPWEQIRANYATDVSAELSSMMRGFRPSHGGQLILWQGEPGTGKTHALRSLASEWRSWADIHYVVDPDEMFGGHADYLLDVLLHESFDSHDEKSSERWRLLVLEDTGELLSADAKERTGQALSRLLNTVDGMIGQGLKVLVLVTTNEELKSLHPAVARPGRCAAKLTFAPLDREAAVAWARARGVEEDALPGRSVTLAELYASVEEFREQQTRRQPVGFTS